MTEKRRTNRAKKTADAKSAEAAESTGKKAPATKRTTKSAASGTRKRSTAAKRSPAGGKASGAKKKAPSSAPKPKKKPATKVTETSEKTTSSAPVAEDARAAAETEKVSAPAPVPQVQQSAADSVEPEAELMQLVTFLLAQDEYGFHIENVQEIIRLRQVRITAIPNAPEFIEGVINLRGRLVPAVDLRKRFERSVETRSRAERVVIVNVSGRTVGLVVDAVVEVAKVGTIEVERLPDLAAGIGTEFVEGVCRTEHGLVVVLDLETMFSEEETGLIQGLAK